VHNLLTGYRHVTVVNVFYAQKLQKNKINVKNVFFIFFKINKRKKRFTSTKIIYYVAKKAASSPEAAGTHYVLFPICISDVLYIFVLCITV